jgi:serine protease AprX
VPDSVETIVTGPLLRRIQRDDNALFRIVIEVDTTKAPLGMAYTRVNTLVKQLLEDATRTEQHILATGDDSHPWLTARLEGKVILALVTLDRENTDPPGPVISGIRPDPDDGRFFNPDNMVRSVVAVPMLQRIEADADAIQSVLIEVNVTYAEGRSKAKDVVNQRVLKAIGDAGGSPDEQFISWKSETSDQYVYAELSGKAIRRLVELDRTGLPQGSPGAIYHIWPDFKVRAQIWRSAATVKADACRRSFATTGRGIVWAVLDSGIDGTHPQFKKHSNLELPSGLTHLDFIGAKPVQLTAQQLTDEYGHGTHVAGIIAGELGPEFVAKSLQRERDENGKITYNEETVTFPVMGMAPECTLLSYRVLDRNGDGVVSTIIAAIEKIQELNGYGRNILIHGVNMSLGYDFDPEWFACGQSPVCVEVDRLVRSGVAVVIAAGNTGKGFALTINDPGNAELAVTVGATHRDMPHRYGVSYFSSKGPTGDGRRKPDLLAPGERILSCGAGPDLQTYLKKAGAPAGGEGASIAYYLERSGTSMAAPHVSGIIAGILSIRAEFVGLPEDIKNYLVTNATDLGRDRNFQGGGLVDMMRTIQAV